MPGTLYGFPYNEELFDYYYRNEPDPITTALVESGAMVNDPEIAQQISKGSELYTVPFYKTIGGDPVNYDGKTDITATDTEGGFQTGVVYGRAKAWKARDFVYDFHKANPMAVIAGQVNRYWAKQRQITLLSILNGIFAVNSTVHSDDEFSKEWEAHTVNIAAASTTIAETNKVTDTTISDATVKACGDLAFGSFGLAIMHSAVAQHLADTQLLEYRKYTDPMGIERSLPIVDINGLTVIVYDGVPTAQGSTSKATEYTSYVLGNGALRYAPAPVKAPYEPFRDPKTNGGEDLLYTRLRETICPNGFTYIPQSGDAVSPTNEMLAEGKRYKPIFEPKCLPMVRIVSNA